MDQNPNKRARHSADSPRASGNSSRGARNSTRGARNPARRATNTPRRPTNTPRRPTNTPRRPTNTPSRSSNSSRGPVNSQHESNDSAEEITKYVDRRGFSKKGPLYCPTLLTCVNPRTKSRPETVQGLLDRYNKNRTDWERRKGFKQSFYSMPPGLNAKRIYIPPKLWIEQDRQNRRQFALDENDPANITHKELEEVFRQNPECIFEATGRLGETEDPSPSSSSALDNDGGDSVIRDTSVFAPGFEHHTAIQHPTFYGHHSIPNDTSIFAPRAGDHSTVQHPTFYGHPSVPDNTSIFAPMAEDDSAIQQRVLDGEPTSAIDDVAQTETNVYKYPAPSP